MQTLARGGDGSREAPYAGSAGAPLSMGVTASFADIVLSRCCAMGDVLLRPADLALRAHSAS